MGPTNQISFFVFLQTRQQEKQTFLMIKSNQIWLNPFSNQLHLYSQEPVDGRHVDGYDTGYSGVY